MKPLLAIASLFWTADLLEAQETPRGGRISWRTDLDRALQDARREGRPLLLYFTADW